MVDRYSAYFIQTKCIQEASLLYLIELSTFSSIVMERKLLYYSDVAKFNNIDLVSFGCLSNRVLT